MGGAGREIGKGGSKRGRDGERDGKGERERPWRDGRVHMIKRGRMRGTRKVSLSLSLYMCVCLCERERVMTLLSFLKFRYSGTP